ncbi:MFS transporter [Arthrobacter sp. ISL-85]|uniref:MFS transporter n=1 Tax=Arthrobacter sp. ISL-85 TaxID=2819115 RepID=UPI001BE95E62|nr:MFS transporter [Arthrobacter sp. ISL-85]MBT2565239.1 MFS transporter [Arthrobacter sp. ISL-85]
MAINLPASVTVALRISEIDPDNKAATYSLVAGIGTIAAALANPFFRRLSDRTRSRFGRRRPWIVVGLLGSALGAGIIGFSSSVGMLILGWVLMQAFVNAAIAASLAIVSDRFPECQQGVAGAISGTASAAGNVIGIFFIQAFPTSILAQIGLPVVLAIVFGFALVAMLRDDRPANGDRPPMNLRDFLGSFYINPRKAPKFAWLLLAIFAVSVGMSVAFTYTVYFLQDQLQVAPEELTNVLFVAMLLSGVVSVVIAPLAGWITDRVGGRRGGVVLAAAIMAAGMVTIATSSTTVQFIIGQTLTVGIGAGILFGTYIALAISTLPDATTVVRDLGVLNLAATVPFSLVPFAAPAVLAIGGGAPNYVLLYLVGGAMALLSVPMLYMIRTSPTKKATIC